MSDPEHRPSESGRYCACGRFWPCAWVEMEQRLATTDARLSQLLDTVQALGEQRDAAVEKLRIATDALEYIVGDSVRGPARFPVTVADDALTQISVVDATTPQEDAGCSHTTDPRQTRAVCRACQQEDAADVHE